MFYEILKKKISKKTITVCVLGLGYVGLPVCYNFAKKGFNVIGFDKDTSKINQLKQGKVSSTDIKKNLFTELVKKKKFF